MPRTGRPPKPAIERFRQHTRETPTGCIEWTGYLDKDGYGQIRPAGRKSTNMRVHRWAYEHFVGPIPDGLVIDHLCKNRACCNPDHLEPVTARENWLRGDGPARINADKTHCIYDHPLSGDNLIVRDGKRACRECRRRIDLAGYHRRKAS